MATIASLVVQIGADIADLRTGVDSANQKIDSFASKASTAFRALTGAAAFGVIVNGLRDIAAAADEIDTLSARISDSAEAVQRLQAVSESFDVEISAVISGIQVMQERLGENKLTAALQAINVDVERFRTLTPSEQFIMAAEALAKIEDPAKRGAAATDIFGKNARGLAGAFREGVGDVDRWIVMSDGAVSATDRVSTMITKAKASFINFSAEIVYSISMMRAFDAVAAGMKFFDSKDGLKDPGSPLKLATGTPGLPDDYVKINEQLSASVEKSIELQRTQTKTADEAKRMSEAFRESIGYFNTADDIGRSFLLSVEDSATEIAEIRDSMAAMDDITFNDTWQGFQAGVADSSRDVDELRARMQKLASWADIGQRLSGAIIGALQGGGSVGKALGGEVGQMLGTKLGTSIGDWAGKNIGGALGSAIGGAAGSVLPVVGTMLGSLAGSAIGKLFGGGEGKQVNDLRDKFVSASGGIHELNIKAQEAGLSLDRLLNAKKVSDFEAAVNELNAALAEQDQMHQRGIAAMEKYGITIDQAGQKFKQTQMNATAEELVKDFTALVSIGVDVDTIIEKMGASVGEFVQRSIEMGTSVPREMEPIIARMIETGSLVDKNGEKFTNLSQIPFADSLNTGMAKLIAKLDVLLEKIGVSLPKVIRDLPDGDFTITGNISAPGLPDVPQLATGGVVRRPTLALIGEAGPEAVVPLSRFGQMSGGSSKGGGETHVHIHGGVFDGYSSEQTFARRVLDVLSQEKERRGRSLAFAGA
jgi:hypothetical protein